MHAGRPVREFNQLRAGKDKDRTRDRLGKLLVKKLLLRIQPPYIGQFIMPSVILSCPVYVSCGLLS